MGKSKLKAPKGFKKGRAKSLTRCCREIRISCRNELGFIASGRFNWSKDNPEEFVMVIKESHPYDMDKIKVVELIKQTHIK